MACNTQWCLLPHQIKDGDMLLLRLHLHVLSSCWLLLCHILASFPSSCNTPGHLSCSQDLVPAASWAGSIFVRTSSPALVWMWCSVYPSFNWSGLSSRRQVWGSLLNQLHHLWKPLMLRRPRVQNPLSNYDLTLRDLGLGLWTGTWTRACKFFRRSRRHFGFVIN